MKILNAGILNTDPSNVKGRALKSFKWDVENLVLEPLLLNSRDMIEFQVGLTGYSHTISISVENSGIVGVREIIERRPLVERSKGKLLFLSVLFILGGQALGFILQSILYPLVNNQTSPFILLFTAHFLVLFLKSFAPAVFFSHSGRSLNKIMSLGSLIGLWTKFSGACTFLSLVLILPTLIGRIFVL